MYFVHTQTENVLLCNPNKLLISMNSLAKYILLGIIVGGLLPGLLHPLKITIFASTNDLLAHIIGAIAGVLVAFLIHKLRTT